MKLSILFFFTGFSIFCSKAQDIKSPCFFDEIANDKSIIAAERIIQAGVRARKSNLFKKYSEDSLRVIPVVVHVIHNGGSENISDAQIQNQIQILNEDYGKISGTNGDGNGVDTRVGFCLAKLDPEGNCTNGIIRIKSPLTNHQSYQRALLKELSFWDNNRYLNIYVVKTINGNVGGYSSFPGGPAEEDGIVVRHDLFGNTGTASGSLGRTTTHELGHWFGLYHVFNNGCGTDICEDGDYVCDTPPANSPHYTCSMINSCSNDSPDLADQIENYMDYTPDACKSMFTDGQKLRIHAALDSIRKVIWSQANLIATGCDSNFVSPSTCSVVADFLTLTPEICDGNSVYFMDKSYNNPSSWQWTLPGGTPSSSTSPNPTVTYNSTGTYSVKLIVSDSLGSDSLEFINYITVSLPGTGDSIAFIERFDNGLYPPYSLTINNPDGGITWELDSLASVTGKYSIKINNLINTNYGSSDELILPYLNLSSAHPDSNVYMSFNWAYAKSDATYSDELLVLLSKDCGVNYSQIFYKSQNALVTGPTQSTPFVPDSTQWKKAYISLNNYRSEKYVQLKIVNVTDGGNNLYIDDIYVGDATDAPASNNELFSEIRDVSVYPNPSSGGCNMEYSLEWNNIVNISIFNVQGILIKSFEQGIQPKGMHKFPLSSLKLNQGLYFVKVKAGTDEKTIRFVIMGN